MEERAEFSGMDFLDGAKLSASHPDRADEIMTKRLCSIAYSVMSDKLEKGHRNGKGGWWNSSQCSIESLQILLRENLERGDIVDVMIMAGMIYARQCALQVESNAELAQSKSESPGITLPTKYSEIPATNKHHKIPLTDGLYWYVTPKNEPEPVVIDVCRYGDGYFKGYNGRRQSWLRDDEYLVGPVPPVI